MKRVSPFLLTLLAACSDGTPAAPAGPAPAAAKPAEAPAAAAAALPKGETTYYFGANPARTKVIFESKTNVTNILGQTNLCSGSVTVDFDKGAGSCHLVVPTLSLNSGMDDRDRAIAMRLGERAEKDVHRGATLLEARHFGHLE